MIMMLKRDKLFCEKPNSDDKFKNNPYFCFAMVKKGLISLNAMDKIMREAGGLRISNDAKAALAEVLEDKALSISAEAKKLAEHAGRKTITEKDIRMAVKS